MINNTLLTNYAGSIYLSEVASAIFSYPEEINSGHIEIQPSDPLNLHSELEAVRTLFKNAIISTRNCRILLWFPIQAHASIACEQLKISLPTTTSRCVTIAEYCLVPCQLKRSASAADVEINIHNPTSTGQSLTGKFQEISILAFSCKIVDAHISATYIQLFLYLQITL